MIISRISRSFLTQSGIDQRSETIYNIITKLQQKIMTYNNTIKFMSAQKSSVTFDTLQGLLSNAWPCNNNDMLQFYSKL